MTIRTTNSPTRSRAATRATCSTSAETTGAITVSGALDHETTASYTLTVEVDDGRDGVGLRYGHHQP